MKSSMRLGIIGSSGGSTLDAANTCLLESGISVEWVIVTDRPCGLESWALASGQRIHRVEYQDPARFSKNACKVFESEACNEVLLFYTRRVTAHLIDKLRVWNIHPSLLPSFRGLHGIRDAFNAGVKIFGATLHRVDEELDTGPIVAQVASSLSENMSLAEAENLSYLQKVWLTLVWVELLSTPNAQAASDFCCPSLSTASPSLRDERLRASYKSFLLRTQREKTLS